jgi:Xaa-Pro aminopeptidase
MTMQIKNRLQRLRRKLAEKEIEALLISQPDNLFYLSGCEGLEGYLLISPEKAVMITDFRYLEQAARQAPDYEVFRISGKMADWFPALFSAVGIKKLGFESQYMSFAAYEQIAEIIKKNSLPLALTPVSGLVEDLRVIKDPDEIDCISQAAKITDAVIKHIENILQPGLSEKAVSWEIEKYMREHGSQPCPFELIVASGPNSALPHARPSDYLIRPGEPVVMDIGAKYRYYGSDLTRTLCTGKTDETFKKVYNTVLEAQLTAIDNIKPGMTGHEADAIARKVIADAGYGDAFGHSLGHGIGLITHENPRVGPNSTDVLTEGMVFTIEPGIYLSGWGGVRIEDDVVIQNGKLRVITSAGKPRQY